MKNGVRQPVAVTTAVQVLVKLGVTYGVEAINSAYAEAIAATMATRAHDSWIARITDGQAEVFENREQTLVEGY